MNRGEASAECPTARSDLAVDLAQVALMATGPARRLNVAVHEAGHVVVAAALGYEVTATAIDSGDDPAGRAFTGHLPVGFERRSPITDQYAVLVLLDGHAAVQVLVRGSGQAALRGGCSGDHRKAARLAGGIAIDRINGRQMVNELRGAARAFLAARDVWPSVMRVAGELLAHGELDAEGIGLALAPGPRLARDRLILATREWYVMRGMGTRDMRPMRRYASISAAERGIDRMRLADTALGPMHADLYDYRIRCAVPSKPTPARGATRDATPPELALSRRPGGGPAGRVGA